MINLSRRDFYKSTSLAWGKEKLSESIRAVEANQVSLRLHHLPIYLSMKCFSYKVDKRFNRNLEKPMEALPEILFDNEFTGQTH